MTVKINFEEQNYQHRWHDIRVYIAGADVSEALSGRIAITISDRESPNTCSFTLDNAMDRFVFTEHNAKNKWGYDGFKRYSEEPKANIVRRKLKTDGKIGLVDRNYTIEQAAKQIAENNVRDYPTSTEKSQALAKELVEKLDDFYFKDGISNESKRKIIEEILNLNSEANPIAVSETTDKAIQDKKNGALFNNTNTSSVENLQFGVEAVNSPKDPTTKLDPYNFTVGDVVIQKHDPIVIFAKNPLVEVSGPDQPVWYRAFTGFVNTVSVFEDQVTGESSININGYCIRALMRRMRVSTNDAYAAMSPNLFFTEESSGIFRDQLSPDADARTNVAQDMSIDNTVEYWVCGTKTKRDGSGTTESFNSNNIQAVGRFSMGEVMEYPSTTSGAQQAVGIPLAGGNPADVAIMDAWHSLSVFGSDKAKYRHTDLFGKFLTENEVKLAGTTSYTGGNGDPLFCKLHMLLPRGGTAIRELLQAAFDQNPSEYAISTRWDVILYAIRELDYQFYTSPTGDLLLEFPMYDFAPEDFLEYKNLFTYFKDLISTTTQDESADMPSGTVVTGRLLKVQADTPEQALAFLARAGATSRSLIYRYGVGQVEMLDKPYITGMDNIATYATIAFQRSVMAASTMDFSAEHRPFMMPNRPVFNKRRNRLGLSQTIEQTWEIDKGASTSVTVGALRKSAIENGKLVYRFVLTGGSSLVVSYRLPQNMVKKKSDAPPASETTEQAQSSGNSSVQTSNQSSVAAEKNQSLPEDEPNQSLMEERTSAIENQMSIAPQNPQPAPDSKPVGITLNTAQTGIVIKTKDYPEKNQSLPEDAPFIAPANVELATSKGKVDRLERSLKDAIISIASCVKPTVLHITDGHRSEADQKNVKSRTKETSDKTSHRKGKAFDIRVKKWGEKPSLTPEEALKVMKCAVKEGFNARLHQGTGPHIHVEEVSEGKEAEYVDELGYTTGSEIHDTEPT